MATTTKANGNAAPNSNAVAKTNPQEVEKQKVELSPSERFTNMVVAEFTANAGGGLNLSPFQKRLTQNFFIKIDMMLKDAEQKRLQKKEQYREPLELNWKNVNMQKLATDVIIFSSVGLDPTQPNHVSPIAFKNKATNKYDITFIIGYRGTELKAKKYGLDIPKDVIVELVYANDKFKAIKRDTSHTVETYEFEVAENSFDRGELVGGFYYLVYDEPAKNKLRVFTKRDIDKRKPAYASAEFWGGTKDVWKDGKKTGEQEEVEGWYDEMAFKTLYKAAYNSITIDSQKIDSNYLQFILKEGEYKDYAIAQEIRDQANKGDEVGFDAQHEQQPQQQRQQQPPSDVDENTGEVYDGDHSDDFSNQQSSNDQPGF